jgi:hypothetical protein
VAAATEIDIDAFVDDGYVVLRGAVPAELCALIRGRFDVPDAVGWHLDQRRVADLPLLADALTDPVRSAFDALIGAGRWTLPGIWGFPWRLPGPVVSQWHIDGDWFHHHLHSNEQVLTPIFLWHDVGDHDGPTLLAPGSHRAVARILAAHEPDGIPADRILEVISTAIPTVDRPVAATGSAGDVWICHPWLAHAINPVAPAAPRLISNVCVHGREPLSFEEPRNAVERAVAHVLDAGPGSSPSR